MFFLNLQTVDNFFFRIFYISQKITSKSFNRLLVSKIKQSCCLLLKGLIRLVSHILSLISILTSISFSPRISNNFSGAGADFLLFFGGTPGSAGGNGGGIYNGGSMILNNCDVVDNFAGNGGVGINGVPFGAFAHDGGTGGSGGGIYNAGSLTLKHCIIGGNSCGNGGSGSDSHGLKSDGVGGDGGNGGAGGSGGGIFNADGSSVTSYNCLFALNQFGIGGSGGAGFPAGTGNNTAGADGNAGAVGFGPDLFGNFISTGHNLVREGDDSTGFTNGVRHDIVGTIAAPANPLQFKFHR